LSFDRPEIQPAIRQTPPLRGRFPSGSVAPAGESRSTQAAARALTINPKLLFKWQKEALTPATAAELRALARRQAQKLEILKKPLSASA